MSDEPAELPCGHSVEYSVISAHYVPDDPTKPHMLIVGIPAGAYMALLNGTGLTMEFEDGDFKAKVILVARPTHEATEDLIAEFTEAHDVASTPEPKTTAH